MGSTEAAQRLRGATTRVIDAGGRAVIPGFNDNHVHLMSGGLGLETADLQDAQTLEEIQERIRVFANAHPERAWVEGRGWNYGAFPGYLPTRQQLDAVVPDRPAIMRCFDGHTTWVNSKALALAGVTKNTPDPHNGAIVRDPKTGEPTGVLKEGPAAALVRRVMPPTTRADQRRALHAAVAEAHKVGITSITDAGGSPEGFELLDEVRRAGELTLRVYYSMRINAGFSEQDADRLEALWRQHPDTPVLKMGLIKMMLDGVTSTHTASMLICSSGDDLQPEYMSDSFQTYSRKHSGHCSL